MCQSLSLYALRTLAVLVLCIFGCGPAFNAASGEDAKRSGALPIQPNTTVDDQISRTLGDDTDWKSLELAFDSDVRVRVWWDEPDVDATITLYDSRARALAKHIHSDGSRRAELAPIGLRAGSYFIKVEVEGGESVYTLEVLSDVAGVGRGGSERPDF